MLLFTRFSMLVEGMDECRRGLKQKVMDRRVWLTGGGAPSYTRWEGKIQIRVLNSCPYGFLFLGSRGFLFFFFLSSSTNLALSK